jgi:hypothetical protein
VYEHYDVIGGPLLRRGPALVGVVSLGVVGLRPGILLGTGREERGSPVKVALLGCFGDLLVTGLDLLEPGHRAARALGDPAVKGLNRTAQSGYSRRGDDSDYPHRQEAA